MAHIDRTALLLIRFIMMLYKCLRGHFLFPIFIMLLITVLGCNKNVSGISTGPEEEKPIAYDNGTLVIKTSGADGVNWGTGGVNMTLMSYFSQYQVNINKHSEGKIMIKGYDQKNSLAYGQQFASNLARVPDADKGQARIIFMLSETQFWPVDGGSFKYFLDGYLGQADDILKSEYSGYASIVSDKASFDSSLLAFLSTLPKK
ncbi:MAG: hypothetical protein OXC40_02825 [Proteobacteria bacterium]|nr:hypothetical protein [Pseudomonadota bacterium]